MVQMCLLTYIYGYSMGITGLLPFLKSIHHQTNVSTFQNKVVVIDAYCWLHRGSYSCPLELIEGRDSEMRYVHYCLRKVNMLLAHGVTPILVFDGGPLPSKKGTEEKRRNQKAVFREKGMLLLREGKRREAYDCFKHCVDIKPEMALNLINACRDKGIQCIVAPYEADSQLAYMVRSGLAYAVISEDSDLLVFGCARVLFKMDDSGNGVLISLSEVGSVKGHNMLGFNEDSFRHMCILSGCDYLDSIPGVGLVTAHKLMRKHGFDPIKVIRAIKMDKPTSVPDRYEENFRRADMTFLYQTVFDPRSECQVPLTPFPPDIDVGSLAFAGLQVTPTKAKGLARGNINPITNCVMGTYTPSKEIVRIPITRGVVEKHQKTLTSFISCKPNKQVKRNREEPEIDDDQLMEVYSKNSLDSDMNTPKECPVESMESVFPVDIPTVENTCVYSSFFARPSQQNFEVKRSVKKRIFKEIIVPDISKLRTLSLPIGDSVEIVSQENPDVVMPSQTDSLEISTKGTQSSLNEGSTQVSDISELSPDLLHPRIGTELFKPSDTHTETGTNSPTSLHSQNEPDTPKSEAELSPDLLYPSRSTKFVFRPEDRDISPQHTTTDPDSNLTTYNHPRNPFVTPSINSPISIVIPDSPERDRKFKPPDTQIISGVMQRGNSQPITSEYFPKQNYRRPLSGLSRPKRRPLTGQLKQTVLDASKCKQKQN